jgi:hypothetical protein
VQHQRDGDGHVALRDEGADFRVAPTDLGAVKPVHPAVPIAGLSAALFSNPNPCRRFSCHSNLMNLHPLPPWEADVCQAGRIDVRAGAWISGRADWAASIGRHGEK